MNRDLKFIKDERATLLGIDKDKKRFRHCLRVFIHSLLFIIIILKPFRYERVLKTLFSMNITLIISVAPVV